MNRQLVLDLGHRTARGRTDFLVSGSNAEAVEWIDRWPDWPARALALWGPAASGKTHLGHVWCAVSGGELIGPDDVRARDAAELRDVNPHLFVDNAHALAGDPVGEEALLHLYNYVLETDGALLLAANEAPSRWNVGLADLASRMKALAGAGISAPDDDLLAALMVKQFQDRQLRVGEDVVLYLVARMERSFASVSGIVGAIDAAALERARPVTVPLAREILENIDE
ncbi:MAG: DNA replication protein [Alphaproteobacteria bacterium]|nr:DNA replication protein [Alphaproteobacteria bacterium]|tara:strand:- start:310 stop:990 length:681 start_codon:yes stop_codon:yes gene_type:complete